MPTFDFKLIQIPGGELPKKALPSADLKIKEAEINQSKIGSFEKVLQRLTESCDPIISEVFQGLGCENNFKTQVVLTNGIPEPYDAWTAKLNNETSIFFNLDLWNEEDIQASAIAIIKHEVTHLILEPFLSPEEELSFSKRLEQIVLDEGIAHFIGFTQDRETLLQKWSYKWEPAELELAKSLVALEDNQMELSEKRELILRANTGSFWNKFGAISGMFRAARIYQISGSQGLA